MARGSPLADFRLKEGRLPTKAELDAAAPRHPTYISFGAHVVIANTLALRERDITRDTPSPQGGTVVKDPLTGELTGELRERAQSLVKRRDGEIDPQTLAERIAVELEQCSHRGVTAIHDIIISKEEVQAYQLLARTHLADGDPAGARRAVDACTAALADIGARPSPATVAWDPSRSSTPGRTGHGRE